MREKEVARPEAQPSTEELVLRAEQQRRVQDELMDLEEPYRTALLLRYQEGLSSAEIAKREGAAADTVRWRLRKGVEKLRERLEADAEGGGLQALLVCVPPHLLGAQMGAVGGAQASTSLLHFGPSSSTWLTGALAAVMLKLTALIIAAVLLTVGLQSMLGDVPAVAPDLAPVAMDPPTPASSDRLDFAAEPGSEERVLRELAIAEVDPVGAAQPEGAATAESAPMSRVVGRVLDSSGLGVADAEVRVEELGSMDETYASAVTTDQLGRFELLVPWDALGRYHIEAQSSDFMTVASQRIGPASNRSSRSTVPLLPPFAPRPTVLKDLELEGGCVLVGRVVSADGQGVSNASIGIPTSLLETTSAADGSFRLPRAPIGEDALRIRSAGWLDLTQPYAGRAAETMDLGDITLRAGPTVSGRVLDAEDSPVADARVYTSRLNETQSDANGRFELSIERERGVSIKARRDDVGFAEGRAVADAPEELVLRLAPIAPIATFRVVDRATGEPIRQYGFTAESLGRTSGPLFKRPKPQASTQDSEVFEARCRTEGDRIHVVAPGYRASSAAVKAAAFEGVQELRLRRANAVTGRVMRGGQPAPFVEVELLGVDGTQKAVTHKDGRFDIPLASGGDFSIVARDLGASSNVYSGRTERRGNTDIGTLQLAATSRLSGRVVWDGPAPLEGHKIQIEGLLAQSTTTDEEGRFSFEGLPEGELVMGLVPCAGTSLKGGEWIEDFHVFHPGAQTAGSGKEILLEPEAEATLNAKVQVMLNGVPAEGYSVRFIDPETMGGGTSIALDAEGSAVCSAPSDRPVWIELTRGTRSLRHPVPQVFSPGSQEVKIAFDAGSLQIKVPARVEPQAHMTASISGMLERGGVRTEFSAYQPNVTQDADGRISVLFELFPIDLLNATLQLGGGDHEFAMSVIFESPIDATLQPGQIKTQSL